MTLPAIPIPRSIYAARLAEFPDFVFSGPHLFRHRGAWADFFSRRIGSQFDGRIIFEAGCFDAGYLSTIAVKYPNTGFIGLDWKCRPLYDGATRIAEDGIHNIALLRGRAQDVAAIFGVGEIDEIWVFHPDPCDRPVELKNRLVSESFLKNVHCVLRNATSSLCLKTDHPGYYQSVKALFSPVPPLAPEVLLQFEITVDSANFWNDPHALSATVARFFSGQATLFERRFLKKRKPIYYFELQKKG